MLSRVAESIFWMSRYIERAENVARFIHVNLKLSLDLGPTTGSQWAPLVYTTGDQDAFAERFGKGQKQGDHRDQQRDLPVAAMGGMFGVLRLFELLVRSGHDPAPSCRFAR